MSYFNWKELLTERSQKLIASGEFDTLLPPNVISSGWLGYSGASEEQIVSTEARLGKTLPLSYREFLKISNGWRQVNSFIYNLWSTTEIDWFVARHQQDWVEPWSKNTAVISDSDYLVYGAAQNELLVKTEYMKAALEISDEGDSSFFLLNPLVVTNEGEWEAWFLANWIPGVKRYRSFWELMEAELGNV